MRVNGINLLPPVSFGYSKKSQKYIEDKAKTSLNKRYGEALLETANTCNTIEEALKKEERRIKTPDENDIYVSHIELFVDLKHALLDTIINRYQDCTDYINSEYSYYNNSFKHCKDNYRENFRDRYIDVLNEWMGYGTVKTPVASAESAKEDVKAHEEFKKEEKEDKVSEIENKTPLQEEKVPDNSDNEQEKISLREAANIVLSKARPEDVMLEVMLNQEGSPKGFSDVMGMEDLKNELQENIVDAINNPEQAELDLKEYGKKMPMGIMLYGPPGCGKTYIVEALANEIDTIVYTLDIGKVGSRFINQTSNNIKASFDYAKQMAKNFSRPVILFMDEMDSMTMKRGEGNSSDENLKQVASLLKCIEDAQKNNVIVVGASNRYDLIDPAIIRRFEMKRFVGAPVKEQRKKQVINNLASKEKAKTLLSDDKALDEIAEKLENYSYASINVISKEAALHAMKRNRADISPDDFIYAIENTNEEKINNKDYKKFEKAVIGFNS